MSTQRLALVNRTTGLLEVLTPTEYLDRGNALHCAIHAAVNAQPQVDVASPNWHDRYMNRADYPEKPEELFPGGVPELLTHPTLHIDQYLSSDWSIHSFYSRGFFAQPGNGSPYDADNGIGNVVDTLASARARTMIVLNQGAEPDVDVDMPGRNPPPRLNCSELIYQAWRDSCRRASARNWPRYLRCLKFVVVAQIVNRGTYYTIQDVLRMRGLSGNAMYAAAGEAFSASGKDGRAFRMLLGTVNGRPIARMCADHAESLGGKRVVKIHVWHDMPGRRGMSALVFELA
ncbi:hypothetical protein DSL72_003854 [Monilinia vaccinii-corymbosi]|uniref:Uncharacterized protein n=1 Tax=Monilinia vaccinii-corymbosi TaxID=61207 RepID=A0A8A3NZ14_9HELO|nr:hypothetical protein DSL72_003854 [Monilinia vaccinii-corymbosi]